MHANVFLEHVGVAGLSGNTSNAFSHHGLLGGVTTVYTIGIWVAS